MTSPISNDKISTNPPPFKGRSETKTAADSRSMVTDPTTAPPSDSTDLERAAARYANETQGETAISTAEQAGARASRIRDLILSSPTEALQAHGSITPAGVNAVLRSP